MILQYYKAAANNLCCSRIVVVIKNLRPNNHFILSWPVWQSDYVVIQTAAYRRQYYTSHYLHVERSLAIALFAYQSLMIFATFWCMFMHITLWPRIVSSYETGKFSNCETSGPSYFESKTLWREQSRAASNTAFIAHHLFFLMVYPLSRPIMRQVERECIVSFEVLLFIWYPSIFAHSFLTFLILLVSVVAVYTLVHYS